MTTAIVVLLVFCILLIAISQIALNIPKPVQVEQYGQWTFVDGLPHWMPFDVVIVPEGIKFQDQKATCYNLIMNSSDRCDKCNAQAYVRILFVAGELLFCGHHADTFSAGFDSNVTILEDTRKELSNGRV